MSLALRPLLHAAAILRPPRAASVARFVHHALAGLEDDTDVDALRVRCERELSERPPVDDATALRRLVAGDALQLLAHLGTVAAQVEAWEEPRVALAAAARRSADALHALGIDFDLPTVHVAPGLPPPYDPPFLVVTSFDRSDASRFGVAEGLHVDARRAVPFVAECAVAHALVHCALGQRSPHLLGRGLEEGLAELLGALHAASATIAAEAAEATFAARLLTPTLTERRERFLDAFRAACVLHDRHGIEGMARLVREGRDAVKVAEQAVASGALERVPLERTSAGTTLHEVTARLLARGRPIALGPLAFHLAGALRSGRRVADAARELALPLAAAESAARELFERAFVLVLSDEGEVLVDDLALLRSCAATRYELPVPAAA